MRNLHDNGLPTPTCKAFYMTGAEERQNSLKKIYLKGNSSTALQEGADQAGALEGFGGGV